MALFSSGPQLGARNTPGSTSTPGFLLPDFGKISGGFDRLQEAIRLNDPQNLAVGEQEGLRGTLSGLLDQSGEGQRAQINRGFNTAANNARGALASRGFAGSSLNSPAQLGVERERQFALGDLNDRLLQQRIGAETGISNNISGLLSGSANQATNLLGSLLGSGGIGNASSSLTAGSGGGGGGAASERNTPIDEFPFGRGSGRDPFGEVTQGNPGGGGGGGGGGQGPSVIDNPFFDSGGGGGGGGGQATPEGTQTDSKGNTVPAEGRGIGSIDLPDGKRWIWSYPPGWVVADKPNSGGDEGLSDPATNQSPSNPGGAPSFGNFV